MNNVWGKFASVSIYTRRHSTPLIRTRLVEVQKRKQRAAARVKWGLDASAGLTATELAIFKYD